jgi:putative ABC transport system ATP-binding protein
MEHFIEFQNVSKIYRMGEVEIPALHDANFTIEKGEICIIVGPSGAGKTTLLNILGGMDRLTDGKVFLDGEEISAYDKKRMTAYRRYDIGFVFQFYNLIQNLTARENVELAAQICKDPVSADEVLEHVGLSQRANNFPSQLSGGEQQRVAIARALINRPSVILADEPTGNLDEANSAEIMKLLENINRMGTTVIVITHSRYFPETMGKRLIHMEKGVIVSDSKKTPKSGKREEDGLKFNDIARRADR